MTSIVHYLVYGDDRFWVEQETRNRMDGAAMLERSEGVIDFDRLLQCASSGSLFSPKMQFLLINPAFLTAAEDEAVMQKLEAFLHVTAREGHGVLISLPGSKPDNRRKVVKALKTRFQDVDCSAFKPWEHDKMADWLRHYAGQKGVRLLSDAADAMVALFGPERGKMAQELDKVVTLCAPATQLSSADLRRVYSPAVVNGFDLQEAIKLGDLKTAHRLTLELLDAGDDAIKLVGLLASQFRLLLQILILVEQSASPEEIARQTGRNPYWVKQLIKPIFQHYTVPRLGRAIQLLAALDVQAKQGVLPAAEGLRLFWLEWSLLPINIDACVSR
ncbi:MAG: DNA polymerase III subunit delta [Candidatus Margulisiibacteriota bacterium]